jgi:hypothetical protein
MVTTPFMVQGHGNALQRLKQKVKCEEAFEAHGLTLSVQRNRGVTKPRWLSERRLAASAFAIELRSPACRGTRDRQ